MSYTVNDVEVPSMTASLLEFRLSKQDMFVHNRIVLHELKLGNILRVFPVCVEKSCASV